MRKLFLAFSLSLFGAATAFAAFSDVPSTHPNAGAIAYVQAQGIVSGYPDGTFKPDSNINRAEFTKIIVGAAYDYDPGRDPSGYDLFALVGVDFSDVEAGEWYVPYVRKAVEHGVIGGYPDGTYKPAKSINFAEAAKILGIAYGLPTNASDTSGDWWRPYIDALKAKNALPSSFSDPSALVTRGEMAEMIYRISGGYSFMEEPTESPEGGYRPFHDSVIGNGETSVIFFYASWCPYCQADDELLIDWYENGSFQISVYKANYDAETDLKVLYGVVQQHTFVKIDGEGTPLDILVGPTESQLRALIGE